MKKKTNFYNKFKYKQGVALLIKNFNILGKTLQYAVKHYL